MLSNILRVSGLEEPDVPPPDLLVHYFEEQKAGFIRILEAHPEGVESKPTVDQAAEGEA